MKINEKQKTDERTPKKCHTTSKFELEFPLGFRIMRLENKH